MMSGGSRRFSFLILTGPSSSVRSSSDWSALCCAGRCTISQYVSQAKKLRDDPPNPDHRAGLWLHSELGSPWPQTLSSGQRPPPFGPHWPRGVRGPPVGGCCSSASEFCRCSSMYRLFLKSACYTVHDVRLWALQGRFMEFCYFRIILKKRGGNRRQQSKNICKKWIFKRL